MRYTTLGNKTGLRVSTYCLGTANFGTAWVGGADQSEAKNILRSFTDHGGTFIDTADYYQHGQAERFLGALIKGQRDQYVLSSKCSLGYSPYRTLTTTGNSPRIIRQSLEKTLERLQTDYLDVYWIHFPDALTPMEEILYTLDCLVRAGKILHIGLSNFPAWRSARATAICERYGWSPVVAIQCEYSLAERSAEREIFPMANSLGLGMLTWSPLGGGLLAGKYRHSKKGRLTDWQQRAIRTEDSSARTQLVDTLLSVAQSLSLSPMQVSMAWLNAKANRQHSPMIPIIGPRSVEQCESYFDCLSVHLDDESINKLDAVSAIALGTPHEVNNNTLASIQGGQTNIQCPWPVA